MKNVNRVVEEMVRAFNKSPRLIDLSLEFGRNDFFMDSSDPYTTDALEERWINYGNEEYEFSEGFEKEFDKPHHIPVLKHIIDAFKLEMSHADSRGQVSVIRGLQDAFINQLGDLERQTKSATLNTPMVRVASRYIKLSKEINFEKYGQEYIGYKVLNYEKNTKTLNSSADRRIKLDTRKNAVHTMRGKGIFLSNSKEYVLDYYTMHEYNAVVKYTFSLEDLVGNQQQLYDREPEITVKKAKVLEIEIYDEDHNLIETL